MNKNWIEAAAGSVKGLVKDHADLVKALARAEKKLEDEKSLLERERRHRVALLEASKECLAGAQADVSYLRFKSDVRKTDENIVLAQDSARILEAEIVPSLKTQLEASVVALQRELLTFCLAQKQDYRLRMEAALRETMDILDEWRHNYREVFTNYHMPVFDPDHSLRLRVWESRIHRFVEEKGLISHHEFSASDQREKQKLYDQQQAVVPEAVAVVPEAVEQSPEPEVSVPVTLPGQNSDQPLPPRRRKVSPTLLSGFVEAEPIPAPEPELTGGTAIEPPESLSERVLDLAELEQSPGPEPVENPLGDVPAPDLPESPMEPAVDDDFSGPVAAPGSIPACAPGARTLSSADGIEEVEAEDEGRSDPVESPEIMTEPQ